MTRLTDATARKALPPTAGQRILWDSDLKGFGLRITATGAKAFILDYRAHGRQRRITLGAYPDWTVAAARAAAQTWKREVDTGADPLNARQARRQAVTVADLYARLDRDHIPQKALRTQADERAIWAKLLLPRFGKMTLEALSCDHVDRLHRDITQIRGTPVRANRTIGVLRRAFNLAIRWGWCTHNPARGVEQNPETRRHRYLDKSEITALLAALDQHPEPISANAIRLLLLTGARRGEVLSATWDMFDLENGIWTKPAAYTKQRKLHRVPLNAPALTLLRTLKDAARTRAEVSGTAMGRHVFPGLPGQPLTDIKRTWAAVCRRAGLVADVPAMDRRGRPLKTKSGAPVLVSQPTVRLHDLRHSFASILVSAGASLPLIGQMLGHTQPQTTQRYAHLFDDPLRSAAEMVGAFVTAAAPPRAIAAADPTDGRRLALPAPSDADADFADGAGVAAAARAPDAVRPEPGPGGRDSSVASAAMRPAPARDRAPARAAADAADRPALAIDGERSAVGIEDDGPAVRDDEARRAAAPDAPRSVSASDLPRPPPARPRRPPYRR